MTKIATGQMMDKAANTAKAVTIGVETIAGLLRALSWAARLSPLKPGYASAVGATGVQAYPSAARWRLPGGALEPGDNACASCGEPRPMSSA
jgi:hypothetical protein